MGSVFSARIRTAPARESRGSGTSGDRGLYRYPPPNGGLYFANHYYLGHKRFDTGEPEVFLFGDLQDVNYLPSRPIKFPYKQPSKNHPLRTLRSFINIQRDSIKLVKIPDSDSLYSIQFTFDSDVDCHFLVWNNVEDIATVDSLNRTGIDTQPMAGPFSYKAGSEQTFKDSDLQFDPDSLLNGLEGGRYDPAEGNHTVPIALVMVTDMEKVSSLEQTQLSLCTIDKLNDGNYSIKIIKQKLLVDGMELLLQELYGLENKQKPEDADSKPVKRSDDNDDDEEDDLGAECVICITENRDTLLLPCRHLCLCNSCAASLRYQSSNCPICRAPFRALLQIKAMQPLDPDAKLDDDVVTGNPKYAVPGYECVPLLQALNGYQLDTDLAPWEREPDETTTTSREQQRQSTSTPQSLGAQLQEHTTTEFGVSAATPTPNGTSCSSATAEIIPSSTEQTLSPEHKWKDPLQVDIFTEQHTALKDGPVVVDIEDSLEQDGTGHQVCGSSVSSETSTKSTDNLLHLTNGGLAHH